MEYVKMGNTKSTNTKLEINNCFSELEHHLHLTTLNEKSLVIQEVGKIRSNFNSRNYINDFIRIKINNIYYILDQEVEETVVCHKILLKLSKLLDKYQLENTSRMSYFKKTLT